MHRYQGRKHEFFSDKHKEQGVIPIRSYTQPMTALITIQKFREDLSPKSLTYGYVPG